jgi:endonuclease YncB( thermonuclease family)
MRLLSLLRVLTAIVLIGAGSASAGPRPHDPWTTTGRAVKIIDGDTFDLLTADRGLIRVRFGGMDAPERGQAFSRRATEHLGQLLAEQRIAVRCFKDDGNAREVCDVSVNGSDVGLDMIRAGLAWHFKRFESEQAPRMRARYAEAEEDARRQRIGLWSTADPMPPWECRQLRRGGGSCR